MTGCPASRVEIVRVPAKVAEHAHILGRADAFGAFAEQQDAAARFDDVLRGGDALGRLVEGEVERMAGGAGDDRVGEARAPGRVEVRAEEVDSCGMGADRVAGEDAGDAAVAG